MICTTCSRNLHYRDLLALAHAHTAAGFEQTRCPECGCFRWPWEFPAPEVKASGLMWRLDSTGNVWVLCDDEPDPTKSRAFGRIWWRGDGTRVREAWPASEPFAVKPLVSGTLADCARALRDAVRKGGAK